MDEDSAQDDESGVDVETSPEAVDDGTLSTLVERVGGIERAWGSLVGLLVVVFGLGSVLFPREVYAKFVWHYFWGPVYADAHGWSAAEWCAGKTVQEGACTQEPVGPVAEPGYTVVSEIGYAVILVLMLVGVGILIRRLGITRYRAGYYALVPFMFFGGALRVVEDAMDAARRLRADQLASGVPASEAATPALAYPLNTFLISPLIYFTVFFVAVFAVVLGVYLEREDRVSGYEYPVLAVGSVSLGATIVYLLFLAFSTEYVSFIPAFFVVTMGLALALTGATWWAIERYAPELNRGTGLIGALVIFGQAVDGVANVVGLDWGAELGYPGGDLSGKHPVNRFVVDTTQDLLPASVIQVTGDAWPFLVIKMIAAVMVVWIFDETVFQEESKQYTIMLLVAVLAVGLGPGTRDMLRATFGI
jgi:uncharacterized membrane protein